LKNTLVIFGSYPDTREGFAWNRQDCDLWVFNEAIGKNNSWVQWCTGILQLHIPAIWRNPLNRNDTEHYKWLQENTAIPVYMQDKYPDVPMSIKYPLDEIVATLLPNFTRPKNEVWDDRGDYATSTLAHALALGIYQGYKRIELWGIGLAMQTEYVYQRPGAMFWIGLALGRGIQVELQGHMFDAPLYGFHGDICIELAAFEKRLEDLKKIFPNLESAYQEKHAQAILALDAFKEKKVVNEVLLQAMIAKAQAVVDISSLRGSMEENNTFITKAREMMKASGDNTFRIVRSEFEIRRQAHRKQCAQLNNDRAMLRIKVDQAFGAIAAADGYKKRVKAVDEYAAAYDADLGLLSRLMSLDARSMEDLRYMNIFDEQYRAAGGQRAAEMMAVEE